MDDTAATISVKRAAQILGVSRGLAYEMARQGRLPVIRFGRRLLVPKKALDALLEGRWPCPGDAPTGDHGGRDGQAKG
jgi:excisionase family DNA binding protein